MPIAISVNMLRLRVDQRMPAAHEKRRTRPQHHRRRQRQRNPVRPRCGGTMASPARWLPISSANTGSVSTSAIQNRRVMSISSGSGASSSETCSGSSAMPQIGQLPGPDLPHLGMHRTGVDRAGGRRAAPAGAACRNFSGSASKRSRQRAAAEEVVLAFVRDAMRGGRRIDLMPQTGSIASRGVVASIACVVAAAGCDLRRA